MLNARRGLLCAPFARLCSMLLPGLLVLSFPTTELQAASRPTPVRLSGQVVVSPVTTSPVFLSPDGTVTQPGSFSASTSLTLTGRTRRPPTLTASIECVADDGASGSVWTGTQTLDSSCIPQGDTRNCTVPFKGTWDGDLPDSLSATATNSELYSCTLAVSLSQAKIEDRSDPFYWLREQAQTIEIVTFEEGQSETSVESSVRSWSDSGDDLPVLIVVEQGEVQTIDDPPISVYDEVVISVNAAPEFHVGSPLLVPSSPVVTLGPNRSEFDNGVVVCLTPEVEHQLDPSLQLYSYFPDQNRWISCTEQGSGQCEAERPEGASDAMVCARVFHFSDWVLGDGNTFHMSFTLEDSVTFDSQEAGLLTHTEKAVSWNCTEGSSCPSSLPEGALVFSKEVQVNSEIWNARLQLSQCNGSGICTNGIGKPVEVTFTSEGVSNTDWALDIYGEGPTSAEGKLTLDIDSTQKAAWYSIKASINLRDIISVPPGVKASGSGIGCPNEEMSQESATLTECLNIVAVPNVDIIVRDSGGGVTVAASNWTGTKKNLDTGGGSAFIGWANEKECSQSSAMGMPPTNTFNLTDAHTNPSGNQTGTLPAPTQPYARVGVSYNNLTVWGYCIRVSGDDIPDPGDMDSDGDLYTEANGDCDDLDPGVNPNAAEVCDEIDNNCDAEEDEGLPDFDQDRLCDEPIDPDDDNDGTADTVDCGQFDSSIYLGAPEIPYDGIDQDCDGSDFSDVDGDGFDSVVVGGSDCDDYDSATHPFAVELPADLFDNNCNSRTDEVMPVIAGGNYHTLFVDSHGYVWAAGDNQYGQLGGGTTEDSSGDSSTPVKISGMMDIVAVAAGADYSLALDIKGQVWAWGMNTCGQLGIGSTVDSPLPIKVPGLPESIITIASGGWHSLALSSTGKVYAWGWNHVGQLGNGLTEDSKYPVEVPKFSASAIVAIAGSGGNSYALNSAGDVFAWGSNHRGQLGTGTSDATLTPVKLAKFSASKIIAVAAGAASNALALDSSGQVWAWGFNGYGQLGNGTFDDSNAPVPIEEMDRIVAIGSGGSQSLALDFDRTLWAWGGVTCSQDEDCTTKVSNKAVLTGLSGIVSFGAGSGFTFALDANENVSTWGSTIQGQLGFGTTTSSSTPAHVMLPSGIDILSVAAGSGHSLILDSNREVWARGTNGSGQLGNGTTRESADLMKVENLSDIVAIAAGGSNSLALSDAGDVYIWGDNRYGQTGADTTVNATVPIRVEALSEIAAIDAGCGHSLALDERGGVWAWGYDYYGQLGDGSTTDRSVPIQIPNLTGIVAISAGCAHSLALDDQGRLWAWGWNRYGQFGDGTWASSLTPKVVPQEAKIVAISAGGFYSLALYNDRTVKAWGYNWFGQLGDGTTADSNVPKLVAGLVGIVAITAGGQHSLAMNSDGQLWGWGDNQFSQLGDTPKANWGTPAKVEGLTARSSVSVGEAQSYLAAGSGFSLVVDSGFGISEWGANTVGLPDGGYTVTVPELSDFTR